MQVNSPVLSSHIAFARRTVRGSRVEVRRWVQGETPMVEVGALRRGSPSGACGSVVIVGRDDALDEQVLLQPRFSTSVDLRVADQLVAGTLWAP